ncbi:sterol carrier protein domain-containing protein [Rhizobium sp. BE258]|uniref:sterol carrier protein domain-containing protein n=1 Tax=Rhizobium sp. BE258 TaxID=2817722 RepID=UPI00286194EC|nr:sterol carrier protein domain-containing protein [Rhizobium sp. BE258]MDR7145183.1 putative acetyltransferase [Rhizobium sp. BE258]
MLRQLPGANIPEAGILHSCEKREFHFPNTGIVAAHKSTFLIDNPRALRVSELRDESWTRPLDLEKFLNARPYGRGSKVVFQVTDPILPENTGVWSVSANGALRSDENPAFELSIQTIAELAFGAQSAAVLAAAGRITSDAGDIDALNQVSASSGPKPYSGISF